MANDSRQNTRFHWRFAKDLEKNLAFDDGKLIADDLKVEGDIDSGSTYEYTPVLNPLVAEAGIVLDYGICRVKNGYLDIVLSISSGGKATTAALAYPELTTISLPSRIADKLVGAAGARLEDKPVGMFLNGSNSVINSSITKLRGDNYGVEISFGANISSGSQLTRCRIHFQFVI